jgi:hypothetical protein
MSIEPALTAEEWVRARAFLPFRDPRNVAELTHAPKGRLAAEIALANAALPDSDPRKFTREHVTLLHRIASMARDMSAIGDSWDARALDTLAGSLASYLPPE